MQEEVNRELLCKDCIYSQAGWMTRLTNAGMFFTCKHKSSHVPEEFDPVTGQVTPERWNSCGSMRVTKCGGAARYWAPRNVKKHLFLQIKHGR